MNVKVLFFAQLKDIFKTAERTIEVKDDATVNEVVCSLFRDMDGNQFESVPFRYAVNEDIVSGDEKLKDRDILAILPPVSGG